MKGARTVAVLFGCLLAFGWAAAGPAATPSFEDRCAARRSIEEVFWRHRIWPKDNPGPKPELGAVLSDGQIRRRVEDALRMSNALAVYWNRPITGEQLQDELDRMARGTQDGSTLRELFAALGNDANLAAEVLARPVLAERLGRALYASDERIHGALKRQALEAVAHAGPGARLSDLGGDHAEVTYRLRGPASDASGVERALDPEEWRDLVRTLADRFEVAPEAIPVGTLSAVRDEETRFSALAVRSLGRDELTLASVSWPKRSFDSWWSETRERYPAAVPAVAHTFALLEPADSACNGEGWEVRYGAPDGAAGHTAVWTGTEMIVWGGTSGADVVNAGARYTPATNSWVATSTGANVPSRRWKHTAVWTGTEMIVWGGSALPETNTGGRYDPLTDTWTATSVTSNTPAPRMEQVAVWTGTHMVVWGGYATSEPDPAAFASGGRYDPTSDSWQPTSMGANVPSARSTTAAVWTGSQMLVWGGTNFQSDEQNTGARYDPSSDSWSQIATAGAPTARQGHTLVWSGTEMIVWGGQGPEGTQFSGRYDPARDTWRPISTVNAPQVRLAHTGVWTGSRMIVWGGYSSLQPMNTGGRYDPATDTWLPTSVTGEAPIGRTLHTAVWTGSRMIVWGGSSSSSGSVFNTGGRYDPVGDTWLATSTGPGSPSARRDATAVWTGVEMIVWGGAADIDVNSGGSYNPALDSWNPTSAVGAPSPRRAHTAVWTGTEMIVWGGAGNSGGRYNPAADAWIATSTGGLVPQGRANHTAVWTGTEMIVWGGGSSGLNTGGLYDPSSNSWRATATVNAPVNRYSHAAVWTGTHMLVWGGRRFTSTMEYLTSGGRYDPLSGTWLPTSTTGVPEPRSHLTAVWTGSQMIVWGGYDSTGGERYYPAQGGRYDPATDSWQPTGADPHAPVPRVFHSAVWTGAEMIVWGGGDALTNLNTGGRYDPVTDSWVPTSCAPPAPEPRSEHVAVWTGTRMLVWGGEYTASSNVALYCPGECPSPTHSYRDFDGDGHGDGSRWAWTCDGSVLPRHTTEIIDDCDDLNGARHPEAPELCNGIDDDCDLLVDEGINLPGASDVFVARVGADAVLTWTAASEASGYDVARGSLSTLLSTNGDYTVATLGCLVNDWPLLSATDPEIPSSNEGFWYLQRATNCLGGGTYNGASPRQVGDRIWIWWGANPTCP